MTGTVAEGRLNPLAAVLWLIKAARNGFWLVLIGILQPGPVRVAAAVAVLAAFPLAVAHWWRFRYRVDDERLEIWSGILLRHHRVVPLGHVRGITLEEPLIHRILGLVRVRVDAAVAGDRSGELSLSAVSPARADALRRAVVRATAKHDEGALSRTGELAANDNGGPRPFAQMSVPMALLEGATGLRYVLVPFALLWAGFNALSEFGRVADGTRNALWRALPHTPEGVAVLAIVLVVAAPAVGALGALLADGGFAVWLDPRRVSTRRGVISRRRISVERRRLLGAEVADSLPRRALGLAQVTAPVGGMGDHRDAESAGRIRLLPLGRRADVGRLMAEITPGARTDVSAHPRAALRRRLVRALALPLAATAAAFGAGRPWWGLAGCVACVLALPLAWDRYRNLGHRIDRWLVIRRGAVVRRLSVVDPGAAVATEMRSSPFQRRAGLATVAVHFGLSVGERTCTDASAAQAAELVARLHPWAVAGPEPDAQD